MLRFLFMRNSHSGAVPAVAVFAAFAVLVCVAVAEDGRPGPSVSQTNETIILTDGNRPILAYNKVSPPLPADVEPVYARSGFIHPVRSPRGIVVTDAFPRDHKHQDGIFCAWVRTQWNGRRIDFWNLAARTGRVVHRRVVSVFENKDSAGFEVELTHRAESEPVCDVLSERWKVEAHRTDGSYHCFDIETTQTALTEHPLLVEKYHYGGMALRGSSEWLVKDNDGQQNSRCRFLTDKGANRVTGNHQKVRWVCLSGAVSGQDVSIAVLSHSDNFRFPQPVRLHPTKPYFCFAPCVEAAFVIDEDHPFSSKYRYLVLDGVPDAKWINKQWTEWTGTVASD